MLHIASILHPTDFSEQSKQAYRLAVSLARDHQARLLLLHVVATLGPELVSFGAAATQLQPETHLHEMRADLEHTYPPDPKVPTEYLLEEGDEATAILQVAQERSCSLIIMGTHGRSGLQRLLLGSVAEKVMRQATCPVLTVRGPTPLTGE